MSSGFNIFKFLLFAFAGTYLILLVRDSIMDNMNKSDANIQLSNEMIGNKVVGRGENSLHIEMPTDRQFSPAGMMPSDPITTAIADLNVNPSINPTTVSNNPFSTPVVGGGSMLTSVAAPTTFSSQSTGGSSTQSLSQPITTEAELYSAWGVI
jgi:hypothetical protein